MINPFRNTVAMDPWDPSEIDVPEINEEAFNLCCGALEAVRAEKRSTSVLLHGEPGSGKTHLLNRLRSYVKGEPRFQIFASVRLQSSPHRFWRYLRKTLVENLTRPDKDGKSQLERIILGRLFLLCGKKTITLKECRTLLERLGAQADLSRNTCKVLEHLAAKRHWMDATAWLKGDSLPESSLNKMNLAHDGDVWDDAEDQARESVLELCRLAGPKIPVVFCFDQVEALQRYQQGDPESLFVFGQGVGTLHDRTNNVLLVSCIQSLFLNLLKESVMRPDYDRLAAQRGSLNPLTREQALKLISARLETCHGMPQQKRDDLYRAYTADLEQSMGSGGEVPRIVLSRCADLFDAWEKGNGFEAGQSDEVFLDEERIRREEEAIANVTPEKTDEIVQGALPLLLNVLDENWREQDQNRPRDVDILMESPDLKVGISLCNQKNMTSLAGRLRRLRQQVTESPMDRLVLIRDPRLPISTGAKKTWSYLEDLKGQKATIAGPDTEVLAALEAMRSLLADVKAGDLANGGRTLGDGVVREWLKQNLKGPAMDFLEAITSEHEPRASEEVLILQQVLEYLGREKVALVRDVADELGRDLHTLQTVVRQHPKQVAYLDGPPPAVFQFIPESAES
jgi:hypothetical protein